MPAPIDTKIREQIIVEYAMCNSMNGVAKKYDVSWATVRKIVKEAEDQINELRDEKQKKYIHDAWDVINAYLAKLMDPKTIKEAKARDCINVVSGLIERVQRQQELNQKFDVMYDNIAREHLDDLKSDIWNDYALSKELRRYFDGLKEEDKKKKKEAIRAKINEKTLTLRDFKKEHEQKEKSDKENLEALFDEVKTEILNEIYSGDDSEDE